MTASIEDNYFLKEWGGDEDYSTLKFRTIEGIAVPYQWDAASNGQLKLTSAALAGAGGGVASGIQINRGLVSDGRFDVAVGVTHANVFHEFGVLVKIIDSQNYIMARYGQTGGVATVQIWKRVAGVLTQLATATAAGTRSPMSTTTKSFYNLSVVVTGNVIDVKSIFLGGYLTDAPEPQENFNGTQGTVSHTLAGGDATLFGTGKRGYVGWRHAYASGNNEDSIQGYKIQTSAATPDYTGYTYITANGALNTADSLAAAGRIIDASDVVYLGDVVGSSGQGDATGFTSGFEPVYGNAKGIIHPSVGDRDWSTSDPTLHTQTGAYDDYWDEVAKPVNKHFYAYTMATSAGDDWRVIVLNTENLDTEQLAWLDYELDSVKGTMKIVVGHRPRYSVGTAPGEGNDTSMQPVWDLMKGRASALISGGPHNYQRHNPLDGITQVIVGSGGESLTAQSGGIAAGNSSASGILRIQPGPYPGNTLQCTYINATTGATIDSFTLTGTLPYEVFSPQETALDNPWKLVLTGTGTDMEIYGELTNATDRSIADPHMGTPSLSCTIRLDHPLALTVLNEECLIRGFRGDKLVFHGPVVTVEEVSGSGSRSIRITAAGVWWRASKRIIRQSTNENGFSITPTTIINGMDQILGHANGYYDGAYYDEFFTGIRT